MIDTGCHPSLIRPYIAENFYCNSIFKSNTPIVTCAGSREAQFKAHIPLFDEFKPLEGTLEFVLFNFHDYFDGIIGIRDLRKLGLNIDLRNKVLYNKSIKIPLHYRNEFDTQKLEIPAFSSILKQVKTNLNDGEILIPEISNSDASIIIPESLLKIQNGLVTLEIRNIHAQTQIFEIDNDFLTPFAERLNEENFECHSFEEVIKNPQIDNTGEFSFENLRTNHLNAEEKAALKNLILKFKSIFHNPNQTLTFTNRVKHEIKTSDEIPIHSKPYRYPYIHKNEVRNQINKMLEDGIIRPSQSPWSSPIWIVPKKLDASGKQKWRIVVDYRKVNEKTIDDRYPLPNINDILDKLGRCQYFTTLDLASGFHQIEMHENSIEKTAFSVENGHYEYVRMPFGLKNAPATFQRVMDNVLKDLQNKICFVYMDDIIIFSTSLTEHIKNLKQVFLKLKEAGLKVQLDKSEFLCKTVEFLGHVVTPEGIRPNQKKIEAIQKFPVPKTAKEIKSFLGLIGYYRRFIKNFAQLTKPLTHCLKKGVKIEHTPAFLNSFETCKKILMNDPILQYPDFTKEFNLTTDASNFAVGAVLSQGTIGKDLPVAYASRTLNPAECNYSTIEKELLAIVWATNYFRPYLYGVKFNIITDHKPLQWLMSLKEPNTRLYRWRLKLQEYNYTITYKKGKLNTNADALSRIQINPIETEENLSIIANPGDLDEFINTLADERFPELSSDKTLPAKEKIIIKENILIKEADPPKTSSSDYETIHTSQENPIIEIPYTEKAINVFKNQIIISIYNGKDESKLNVSTEKVFDKNRTFIKIPQTNKKDHFIKILKEYFQPGQLYCLHFTCKSLEIPFIRTVQKLFKNKAFKLMISNNFVTDLFDEEERNLKLKQYHEGKTCHRGIQENLNAIKRSYYWPRMEIDVKNYINACSLCQKNKYERHPTKMVFKPTPIGYEPFDHLYIDTYKYSGQCFVTIVDSFSKFGQAYAVKSLNAIETTDRILRFFNHFGIPRKITCDNGIEWKNDVFQGFCRTHELEIHYVTIYNPNSNSPVERFHSTLAESLRTLQKEKPHETIENLMNYAILSYNNSIHTATNYTPFQIIKGKLNYKNPFEISEQTRVAQYVRDHCENINIIKDLIYNRLIDKQNDNLQKLNVTRQNPQIDVDKPLYIKETRPIKSKKATHQYIKSTNPELVDDNKIKIQNKVYHRNLLKPQRMITGGPRDGTNSNYTPSISSDPSDNTEHPRDYKSYPSTSTWRS